VTSDFNQCHENLYKIVKRYNYYKPLFASVQLLKIIWNKYTPFTSINAIIRSLPYASLQMSTQGAYVTTISARFCYFFGKIRKFITISFEKIDILQTL